MVPLNRERVFAPGVFGRFDLAALAQPPLEILLLFSLSEMGQGAQICEEM
jgi:hypothetical protein